MRLGRPPEPCPGAKSAPLVSRLSPAPLASSSPLPSLPVSHRRVFTFWVVHTHSFTHTQISGTNGPRVLLDPCPGSLQVSAPRVPFADKATSCLLKAWCSGSGPFLRSFSLFSFCFLFCFVFFSFFKKTSNKKDNEKKRKRHVSEEMSLSVVFGELVS